MTEATMCVQENVEGDLELVHPLQIYKQRSSKPMSHRVGMTICLGPTLFKCTRQVRIPASPLLHFTNTRVRAQTNEHLRAQGNDHTTV